MDWDVQTTAWEQLVNRLMDAFAGEPLALWVMDQLVVSRAVTPKQMVDGFHEATLEEVSDWLVDRNPATSAEPAEEFLGQLHGTTLEDIEELLLRTHEAYVAFMTAH